MSRIFYALFLCSPFIVSFLFCCELLIITFWRIAFSSQWCAHFKWCNAMQNKKLYFREFSSFFLKCSKANFLFLPITRMKQKIKIIRSNNREFIHLKNVHTGFGHVNYYVEKRQRISSCRCAPVQTLEFRYCIYIIHICDVMVLFRLLIHTYGDKYVRLIFIGSNDSYTWIPLWRLFALFRAVVVLIFLPKLLSHNETAACRINSLTNMYNI